jgi:diguanylate cyclase (GGDEF)-like protein
VPWERFVRSRRREAVLLGWSLFTILVIGSVAALDGGARSPMTLALVLPACFASLAYSRFRVLAVGLAAEAALGILVLIGSPGTGTVLVGVVVLGGIATIGARQAEFHHEWRRQLAYHSLTDPLTGLLNRRGFGSASAGAFDGFRRGRVRVTLVLLDLDLFKNYNDVYGHLAGDELLRWVGEELAATVRAGDSVARIGGDEFAVLLPETDAEAAAPLVAELDARLSRRVPHSLGVASAPGDGTSFEQLYEVADASLYARKFARGNRAVA